MLPRLLQVSALLALAACAAVRTAGDVRGRTTMQPFGTTQDGSAATLYVLESPSGMVAKITDFGATLVELRLRDGTDVVLGFDELAGYESEANQYFGCTVGRVANRIAKGRFVLDGRRYSLATNNGPNHLHGGERGFGQRMWSAAVVERAEGQALELTRVSPDGEEGYPGRVTATVTYVLTREDDLRIEYHATSDAPTPINLTNHSYFNLAGAGSGTIYDHVLELAAERYTPVDDTLIPTGLLARVAGTPLDFRRPTAIGLRLEELADGPTLGYDHNFVLDGEAGELRFAARLQHPATGRTMEVWTTEPGIQLYSGNFLYGQLGKGGKGGKGGKAYYERSALCLECQHFPDSVNHPSFPSTILRAGRVYEQTTVYRFPASARGN